MQDAPALVPAHGLNRDSLQGFKPGMRARTSCSTPHPRRFNYLEPNMWSSVPCSTLLYPMPCQQLKVLGFPCAQRHEGLVPMMTGSQHTCTEAWRILKPMHSTNIRLPALLGWRTGAWRCRRRACWRAARRSPGSCPGPQSAAQPSSPRLLMAQEKKLSRAPFACVVLCITMAC